MYHKPHLGGDTTRARPPIGSNTQHQLFQRAAMPSYNAIFSELAAQAKNDSDGGRGGGKNPRRATVAARSVPRSVMPRGSRGLVGER